MQSNIGGSILDHFSSLTLDHQLIIYLSIQFFSDTENRNGMVWSYPQKKRHNYLLNRELLQAGVMASGGI